jgi:hypothetical protein
MPTEEYAARMIHTHTLITGSGTVPMPRPAQSPGRPLGAREPRVVDTHRPRHRGPRPGGASCRRHRLTPPGR